MRDCGTSVAGNGAYIVLALAAIALLATLGLLARQAPATLAAGTGPSAPSAGVAGPATVTCGGPGQAACPGAGPVWIPIASTSPSDLLAAARRSTLFQGARGDAGDHAHDLSRLGTPVFVQALQPAGSIRIWPDFYVVPILDANGAATDAAELELNPAHTAIHVVAIVTYAQPHAGGAIARRSAADAVAALTGAQHVAMRAGVQPTLVYFPGDAAAQQSGTGRWMGGGEYPADPIWLVPGADGRDHVVGADGGVYSPDQLPMMR